MDASPNAKLPRTEEGLQAALQTLAEARAAGNEAGEAGALRDLAYLVKWVRSDNEEPPFERSHTLALQARSIYRNLGDKSGQIAALLLAVPMEPRDSAGKMLREAGELAKELGSELDLARVTLARARNLAMSDRKAASGLTREALELFRRCDHKGGMANCYFTLSISDGTSAEKRAHALEAARLYQVAGHPHDAEKALTIALMNSESPEELSALEQDVKNALVDAQGAQDRYAEARCYRALAEISEASGDPQEAEKYLRWEADLKESDGLTRTERREQHLEMTRMMIAMAKRTGNAEVVNSFNEELRRLGKEQP